MRKAHWIEWISLVEGDLLGCEHLIYLPKCTVDSEGICSPTCLRSLLYASNVSEKNARPLGD
jgi:hypothetical protein